jgi:hypothetical protein
VGGCVSLISSGTSGEGSSFIDASEDGSDTFFLTGASLVPTDPGAADVYDARVGGGYAEPEKQIECEGDACQPLPEAPEDPTVDTLIPGIGNPKLEYPKISGATKSHHAKSHRKRGHRKTSRRHRKRGGRR